MHENKQIPTTLKYSPTPIPPPPPPSPFLRVSCRPPTKRVALTNQVFGTHSHLVQRNVARYVYPSPGDPPLPALDAVRELSSDTWTELLPNPPPPETPRHGSACAFWSVSLFEATICRLVQRETTTTYTTVGVRGGIAGAAPSSRRRECPPIDSLQTRRFWIQLYEQ